MALFVLGEFERGEGMVSAIHRLRALGYRDIDGHCPYPVEGMAEALDLAPSLVPRFVLIGGLLGATFGYLMMYWCNVVDYPINVGGRPLHSYPAFIPITFELAILFGSATRSSPCCG